jgi:hypothetical protein
MARPESSALMPTTPVWRGSALRALRAVLVAAGVAGAYALLTPVRGGTHAYYLVAPQVVAAVFAGTATAALAGELIGWRYGGPFALLGAVGTGLLLTGLLLIFSVGLPLLLAGSAVLLVSVALALHRGASAGLAVASGVALAAGLGIVLYLAVVRPPVVACRPGGGVSTSALSWWGGGGSSSMTATGTRQRTVGTIRHGGAAVEFVCQDGRLTELHRKWR